MKERTEEMQKNTLAVVGFACFFVLCFVTFLNTYRMVLLEAEVQVLREAISKCEPKKILDNESLFTDKPYISRKRRHILNQSSDQVENYSNRKHTGSKGGSNSDSDIFTSPWNAILQNEKGGVPKSAKSSDVVKHAAIRSLDSRSYISEEYNSGSSESEISMGDEPSRRTRPRIQTVDERYARTGRIKPLPSIHLSGDTSSYVLGTHENFNGNGHLRHTQSIFVDWKVSNWVDNLGMMSHFEFDNGYLTIKERGLYLVYAQIYYLDKHDANGYRVFRNGNMILQCTVSLHGGNGVQKGNTCYTSGVEYMKEGDKVSLGDILHGHYSLFEPGKSFFGAVKLGDFRARI